MNRVALTLVLIVATWLGAAPAQAALVVTKFELKPSTTRAGGNPGLHFSAAFTGADNNVGVKDISFVLPAGMKAFPKAAKVCSKRLMIRNDCPDGSRIGQIVVTGSALGTRGTVRRDINRLAQRKGEVARLGAVALPGIIVGIPLKRTPGGELLLAIDDLPQIGGAIAVQLESVDVRIKAKVRKRALLANPPNCSTATTLLDVGFHDPLLARVSASSSFTPTGCS